MMQNGEEEKFYAMKAINKKAVKSKDYFTYLKLEKQILLELDHPFLLKLHYSFQDPRCLYMVLDLEVGGSLFF